jgi:aromatic ring hydroxylase
MITSSEYRKRLSKMRRNLYNNGKLIDREYKQMQGAINIIAKRLADIKTDKPYTFDRLGNMPGL